MGTAARRIAALFKPMPSNPQSPQLRVVSADDFGPEAVPSATTTRPSLASPQSAPSMDSHSQNGAASSSNGRAPRPAGRLQSTESLLEELARASAQLETATPQEILQWAVDNYAPRFTMATAFGPEGMVILHMLAGIAPDTPIFNLETGYQFQETLELRDRVARRYGIEVELKKPELTVEEYEAKNGGPLYKTNPDQCCADRKVAVLYKAVEGMHAWASAIRRDQSPDRAHAPIVGWDRRFSLVKVSPLANWTKQDVWRMIAEHDIPYNPLHDQGYTSIGCWPCTRAVLFGEDDRAGRWSGTGKTECGLHSLHDLPSLDVIQKLAGEEA
jgi:phosphoadenosine phosphosulfate reductase